MTSRPSCSPLATFCAGAAAVVPGVITGTSASVAPPRMRWAFLASASLSRFPMLLREGVAAGWAGASWVASESDARGSDSSEGSGRSKRAARRATSETWGLKLDLPQLGSSGFSGRLRGVGAVGRVEPRSSSGVAVRPESSFSPTPRLSKRSNMLASFLRSKK